jgi:hypothetical protein
VTTTLDDIYVQSAVQEQDALIPFYMLMENQILRIRLFGGRTESILPLKCLIAIHRHPVQQQVIVRREHILVRSEKLRALRFPLVRNSFWKW